MQFIFYCLCGGIGATSDFFIYYMALSLGIWYQGANVLGYFSGTLISFFLNRRITFNARDHVIPRLVKFLSVAAVGFAASAFVLWVSVEGFSLDVKLSKLIALPVVVAIQYFLNKKFTFKVN